jgi:hypothetical protein
MFFSSYSNAITFNEKINLRLTISNLMKITSTINLFQQFQISIKNYFFLLDYICNKNANNELINNYKEKIFSSAEIILQSFIDINKEYKALLLNDKKNNDINNKELREKETSLYNILKAFWNLDKEVGYCQGMNLIVGFLLLISEGNELDTFYLLISNFSSTFKERKKYNYSFRGLFSEEFPLLYFLNFIFYILLEENVLSISLIIASLFSFSNSSVK